MKSLSGQSMQAKLERSVRRPYERLHTLIQPVRRTLPVAPPITGSRQGNRTWNFLDMRIGACPIRSVIDSTSGMPQLPEEAALDQFVACLEGLKDPRTGNAGLHDFHELLMIALCTVLCGGQGAADMAAVRRGERAVPARLPQAGERPAQPRHLQPPVPPARPRSVPRSRFSGSWRRFSETVQGVVAIDGKVLRRSFDRASGKSALHMVSAWGCEQRLVLAQIATDAKSNEITAVPKLLEMLSLKGTIVTADALNCQRDIAQQIVDQGGDYALALKGNQGTLHDDVVLLSR